MGKNCKDTWVTSLVSFFRRPFWLHSWQFYSTTAMQPSNSSRDRCVRSKKQQTSPEILIYRHSERRYLNWKKREASQLHSDSNCKHSTQKECNWGDQNMVKSNPNFLQDVIRKDSNSTSMAEVGVRIQSRFFYVWLTLFVKWSWAHCAKLQPAARLSHPSQLRLYSPYIWPLLSAELFCWNASDVDINHGFSLLCFRESSSLVTFQHPRAGYTYWWSKSTPILYLAL